MKLSNCIDGGNLNLAGVEIPGMHVKLGLALKPNVTLIIKKKLGFSTQIKSKWSGPIKNQLESIPIVIIMFKSKGSNCIYQLTNSHEDMNGCFREQREKDNP